MKNTACPPKGSEPLMSTSRHRWQGLIYLMPALLVITMAVGYPIVHLFEMAFGQTNSFGIITGNAGFKNFSGLFASGLMRVILNTVIWTAGILVPTIIISLALAYAVSLPLKGQSFFRTIIIIPWAIPLTIVAILGDMAFNSTYGQVNTLLLQLHLISHPIGWLATARTSFPVMMILAIWVSIPFTTLTLLSGIQAVPGEILEASAIDGAEGFYRFRKIILPQITNALQLVVLINLAYIFNSFPIIWIMTQGGPASTSSTITIFVYQLAFTLGQFGQAGAAALLAFIILMGLGVAYVKVYRRTEGNLL